MTELVARSIVTLPLYPGFDPEQLDAIVEAVKDAVADQNQSLSGWVVAPSSARARTSAHES